MKMQKSIYIIILIVISAVISLFCIQRTEYDFYAFVDSYWSDINEEDFKKLRRGVLIDDRKLIVDNYLKEHNEYKLVDYYIDDGYSGTNFNRPEFQRMLEDIKNKKILRKKLKLKKLKRMLKLRKINLKKVSGC